MHMKEKIGNQDIEEIKNAGPKTVYKYNFDRSDLISILAVLLSLGAFGVSIIQANIMKDQQEIMATQQRSSIFPYLIPNTGINTNIKDGIDYTQVKITITNKGFGPALLDSIKLTYNNKIYTEGNKLLFDFISNQDNLSFGDLSVGSFKDVFLSPGEEITMLNLLIEQREGQDLGSIYRIKLNYKYCSILKECWTYENGENTLLQ